MVVVKSGVVLPGTDSKIGSGCAVAGTPLGCEPVAGQVGG